MSEEKTGFFKSPRHVGSFVVFCVSVACLFLSIMLFACGNVIVTLTERGEYFMVKGWQTMVAGTYQVNIYSSDLSNYIRTDTVVITTPYSLIFLSVVGVQSYLFNILAITLHKKVFKVFTILSSILNSGLIVIVITIALTSMIDEPSSITTTFLTPIVLLFEFSALNGIVSGGMAPRNIDFE